MTLNILCGLEDTSTAIKLNDPAIVPNNFRYNYFNSPVFLQYHLDSMQLVNQKTLVDIRYKPHLSWVADAGFLSSTPDFYSHPGFSVGLALVVPIYDGNLKKVDYQRLNIQEKSRLNYISYYKNQYNLQYVMLHNQLLASSELVKKLKTELQISENLIDMSRRELNTGDISVTDFILIVRNNIDLRNNLNLNQVKSWQIINDINYYNW